MKVHIKRAFCSSSDTYDSSCDIQRIVASHLAGMLKSSSPENILEIGSGTGVFTRLINERYGRASVLCVDIAESLLKKAKKNYPGNHYLCADGENLSLNSRYDMLVSSSAVQWFQKPEESLPALLKLVKKGGEYAFSIFVEGTFAEMAVLNSMTGFGSVYSLPAHERIVKIFEPYGAECEIKEYVIRYDSVNEFLKKQKGTGATFSGAEKIASKSSYKKFLELYPMLFGENGKIPVTCRILYIRGFVC